MRPLYWLIFLDVKLFTIFWILAYLLKVIPETRRASDTAVHRCAQGIQVRCFGCQMYVINVMLLQKRTCE